MTYSSFSEVLKPLAARLPRVVREQEILRVRGVLPGSNSSATAELARQQVLRWAEKRSGGKLPRSAWDCSNFDYFSGGRNSSGIRISNENSDIWCIRADDPDKTVAERIWTTEVVIGFTGVEKPRFSARLLVSTPEAELDIEPHTPGFIQQVSEKCGLARDGYALSATPWIISSDADAYRLMSMLSSTERRLPVFVLTVPFGIEGPNQTLLDSKILAKAVLGIGHVVVVPSEYTWHITEVFGKQRSVFGGAVRVYLPGFSEDANPYAHRLFIAEQLQAADGVAKCSRWFRRLAAAESVRKLRLGHDVVTFASLRAASLEISQKELENSGASVDSRIAAMSERMKALEKQVEEDKSTIDYFSEEHEKAEDRAKTAEMQAQSSAYRIQQLLEQIKAKGEAPDSNLVMPDTWEEFADWCDVALAGRVVLTTTARKSVRAPLFGDAALAARCLLWLANEGRDRRSSGGGSLREEPIEDGIRNAHCGSDMFSVLWNGQQYDVDWHIKNGGNTRSPDRCLRIYYFWDVVT